jgi:beta-lactamase regulating signal transducer with metallopeptidase domain
MAVAMAYSLMVAVLLSGAGYALERAAALCRFPRRGVWAMALVASWLLPLAMMIHASRAPAEPTVSVQPAVARVMLDNLMLSKSPASAVSPSHWPNRPALDETLAIAWGSSSCALLVIWAVAAIRLYRRAKVWPVVRIDGAAVSISDRFGPAVLGYVRPRIVMPNAVLNQSNATQSIALKHEQSHIAADDPALLLVGLVLVILAPWNFALWWQLRRLRFAIEVDCDARVLDSGVETVAYGETLLSISQQGGLVPLGMVALTEPPSQLERRVQIMMTGPVRFRKALTGLCLAIATSLVFVATGLGAPAAVDSSVMLRKPPPGYSGAPPEKFVALIKDRYPTLANHSDAGTPVLMVLFNHDGTVARTDKDVFQGSPRDFNASKALSEHFGMTPETIGYVGAQTLDFGVQTVLVVYSEKSAQHIPFTSKLFPDSRLIDRALAERFFPSAIEHGVSTGEGIWVLLDRDGTVLRTGQESFEPAKLIPILESRYPGIKATEMTVTPVVDANMQPVKIPSGGELHLYSVWLDVGSPRPGA